MALSYPLGFPAAFCDPVAAAEARAERQFLSATKTLDFRDYNRKGELKRAAHEYVATVVLAFGRQACAAVRAGEFGLSLVPRFMATFERDAMHHAYYHFQLQRLWTNSEYFFEEATPQFHRSDGWLQHLEERERCVESISVPHVPPAEHLEDRSSNREERGNAAAAVLGTKLLVAPIEAPTLATATRAIGPARTTTKAMHEWRRLEMRVWCARQSGQQDFTMKDLARRLGISDSVLRGIVRDDPAKANGAQRGKLLELLGISVDDWYARR